MLIPQFQSLGESVASAWAPLNFDNAVFPQLAADALRAADLCQQVSGEEIIEWVAATPSLPQQQNLGFGFGEPPITLFWRPRFYIEALYWTVGTPSIHQHGFSGAFTVLEGSSIQSCYAFDVDRRVNAHMLLGTLRLRDVKLLSRGDVEPIRGGSDFIHSTFHLDTPSITIVLRTTTDIEHAPQYTYRRPYLAINQFHEDQEAIRRIQVLLFLEQTKSSRFDETATRAIESSNLYVAYRVLQHLRFSPMGSRSFDRFLEVARERHGPDVDRLKLVADELDRQTVISTRRARLTSPDHRFLLALLMNVPSRDAILSLVQSRFPQADPKELVAQWAFEMSGRDVSGIDFNDLNRSLFRHLMDGVPIAEVIGRLGEEYAADEIEDHHDRLVERCEKMQRSTLFRPLLEAAV